MIIELELIGNLTVMNVEVTGYFTQYTEATYWQPSEGGYFEIEKIERNGRDVTKLLDNLKGNKRLLEDIANNIEENYNDLKQNKMTKTINNIFEAAKNGGYTIKEINCNKSGCKVWIERDYLFMECYFDLSKNEFKHHYLTQMDDKFILAKGINFSK